MKRCKIEFAKPGIWNRGPDSFSILRVPRLVRSGQYIRGRYVEDFEKRFAEYCGTNFALGTSNGSDALVISLLACGVSEGDEVIVPAHTFKATIYAILQTGATPVIVDCDSFGLISEKEISENITEKTKAIIAVHMHGAIVDIEAIRRIIKSRNIYIIEDASQCHGGGLLRSKRVGSLGDVAAFSLYPTKNLGAIGDAGIITTSSSLIFERCTKLSNWMEVEELAFALPWNRRMDALQGIFLQNRLKRLESNNSIRIQQAMLYEKYLRSSIDIGLVELLHNPTQVNSVFHHFVVLIEKRDQVQEVLKESFGIPSLVHYRFKIEEVGFSSRFKLSGDLPISIAIRERTLSLPIGRHLSLKSIQRIAKCLILAINLTSSKTNKI